MHPLLQLFYLFGGLLTLAAFLASALFPFVILWHAGVKLARWISK